MRAREIDRHTHTHREKGGGERERERERERDRKKKIKRVREIYLRPDKGRITRSININKYYGHFVHKGSPIVEVKSSIFRNQ